MSHTGIVYDDIFMKHETFPGHPERAERLGATIDMLDATGLRDELVWIEPRDATLEDLARVHEPHYVDFVRQAVAAGERLLDLGDTCVGPHSYAAALKAAGAGLSAIDAIVVASLTRGLHNEARFVQGGQSGAVRNAFCAVRPPGHHACMARAMGFCIFNNLAVAARYAQAVHRLEKVLIIDWDIHHGNGTQDAFYMDDTVLYISTHQTPHFPGTGAARQTGHGRGEGLTLNIPMRPGSGDVEFRPVFENVIIPRADAFEPDLVLVSAGFDGHIDDPLSGLALTTPFYGELTRLVRGVAERHAGGRLVSVLEGGYNLEALTESVEAHLRALMEED